MNKKKLFSWGLLALFVLVFTMLCFKTAPITQAEGSLWALFPPVVAIVLALITKEVYSSLFFGIVSGALLYNKFDLVASYNTVISDGFIASLADSWNVGILIFLVILGAIVSLVNKAGGSYAYGQWASQKIKSKKSASFATMGLGVLIFVDDYFNCLTVGSVMRPVTDKHKISRAKLAYFIDATAAPVCMIAPVSSWAAAVSGVVEGQDGLALFVQAIPYNLYSLLTIFMMILIIALNFDFGPMKVHEENAQKGDLYTTPDRPYANAQSEMISTKGKVIDLVLPIVVLIMCCILGMLYTGGFRFNSEVNIIDGFANCDASLGLSMGSIIALLFAIVYYMCRRILKFSEIMNALPDGFKAMVPAIMILTFAWTLNSMTSSLGADVYISQLFEGQAQGLANFLPAMVFIVAVGLSFSTGTSWGTFGILLPIVTTTITTLAAKGIVSQELLVIAISACLAGAVCGDHCSPISDTTIMSSTGAQCNHINHVSTQIPYAIFVAIISFIGYIIAAFVQNVFVVLGCSMLILAIALLAIKKITDKKVIA